MYIYIYTSIYIYIYSFNIQLASLVITIQLVAAPGRLAHSHVAGIENPKSAQGTT